jgi:hypothetical protein
MRLLQLSSRAPALVWIGWLVENQAASPIKTAFEFGGDGRHAGSAKQGKGSSYLVQWASALSG